MRSAPGGAKRTVIAMPTNDERREVAARLRRLSGHREVDKEFVHEALGLYMGECVDGYDPVSVSKLADLIEPEERTCHDVSFDSREFVCSWCGCHIDVLGIESEPTMWLGGSPIEPSFCPNCGAKVVRDA